MLYPLKFIPVYKDYIWGGRGFEKFGRDLPEGIVAESWELSCHPDGISVVADGEFKGMSLVELLKAQGESIIGTELPKKYIEKFPLLVKFIDANDKLSVQVHPEDEYAQVYENGELGKNEMWYVLDAKPGAKLVYGLAPGTTREKFASALESGDLESSLRYVDVFPGDVINIPAGALHAIGEGIMIAEVQQSSNTTYRVYDYNRTDKEGNKRPLHIKQALDVIDFSGVERNKSKGLKVAMDGESYKTYVIANKYFSIELYTVKSSVREKADESKFYIYVFTDGEGEIAYDGGAVRVKAGETVLIPAALGNYMLKGNFKALKAYIPDLQKDVISSLQAAGYSKDSIYGILAGIA